MFSFFVDSRTPSTLYAVSAPECSELAEFGSEDCPVALFKSPDGGRNWTRLLTESRFCGTVVVDSSDSAIVYAIGCVRSFCDGVLLESTDGGASWSPKFEGAGSVVVAPGNPAVLLTSRWAGVWKSVDRGEIWRSLEEKPFGVSVHAIQGSVHNPECD